MTFRRADKDEDRLNNLNHSSFDGRGDSDEESHGGAVEHFNVKGGEKTAL